MRDNWEILHTDRRLDYIEIASLVGVTRALRTRRSMLIHRQKYVQAASWHLQLTNVPTAKKNVSGSAFGKILTIGASG